jgi:hypothetical protein
MGAGFRIAVEDKVSEFVSGVETPSRLMRALGAENDYRPGWELTRECKDTPSLGRQTRAHDATTLKESYDVGDRS